MKHSLYIVYSIDTEGPLVESIEATFERLSHIFGIELDANRKNLRALQKGEFDHPLRDEIARVVSRDLINYNGTWGDIDLMLNKVMNDSYRDQFKDSNGKGIVYNWHCLDHVGFKDNPRERDLGYGKVFRHYSELIENNGNKDRIHWHFHPIAFNKAAHTSATSYDNSMYYIHQSLSRRLIDHNWFPVVNRAGFHTIRQDSSFFLERWVPFDFSNQSEYEKGPLSQRDLNEGRFGDWRRAPVEWKPYHPSHDDYQEPGGMNRYTTKCLNIGTRLRLLTDLEIAKAFDLSVHEGSAILSFTNHDFRDIDVDIQDVYSRIFRIGKEFPTVGVLHCDAVEAMQRYLFNEREEVEKKLSLKCRLETGKDETRLEVNVENGSTFGSQPYLAVKTKSGRYFHDNFDEVDKGLAWRYTFDYQTVRFSEIKAIAVASNDPLGNTEIVRPL